MMDTSADMTSIAADCRMEMMEQYARRDCLMFFGLEEEEGEDTTQKVVETVNAMGANLSAEEVSISQRLFTRNRSHGEPRPVIAKFIRRSVKQQIYHSKHLLHYSENHFRVYIKEHLTKERAKAIYLIIKAGYEVTTDECRINYKKNSEAGVINSLSDLQSKLNWEAAAILKVLSK